ncbi:MAG: hypothetical protein IT174_10215 [Acidobacteria bacterium]|nr:hypothetical protein [Acidobacteriota bacterium]
MAKNISFLQYMQAHGNTPGPTQRPLLTGALGGIIAAIPSAGVLYWSGSLAGAAERAGVTLASAHLGHGLMMVLAGMIYAAIFKRAANDRQGGWLFGAAFGFLVWMFTPVSVWQLFAARPLAVGRAAIGLFAAHILFGLVLGLIYPRIHTIVQSRLIPKKAHLPTEKNERRIVRHPTSGFVERSSKNAESAGSH